MIYQITFQRKAKDEIFEAYRWYEQKQEGLGEEFLGALDVIVAKIETNPNLYPLIWKDFRRALLPKFPYAIFYKLGQNKIIVSACFHLKRDPKEWQKRIN
jgi:plasmid stabilization system protein ParE